MVMGGAKAPPEEKTAAPSLAEEKPGLQRAQALAQQAEDAVASLKTTLA